MKIQNVSYATYNTFIKYFYKYSNTFVGNCKQSLTCTSHHTHICMYARPFNELKVTKIRRHDMPSDVLCPDIHSGGAFTGVSEHTWTYTRVHTRWRLLVVVPDVFSYTELVHMIVVALASALGLTDPGLSYGHSRRLLACWLKCLQGLTSQPLFVRLFIFSFSTAFEGWILITVDHLCTHANAWIL